MKSLSIVIRPQADLDVQRHILYLEEHEAFATAAAFNARFDELIERLAQYPEIGVKSNYNEHVQYRSMRFAKYHRVIYNFDGNTLYVIRVWDTRHAPADLQL